MKVKKKSSGSMTLLDLINKWSINRAVLASKIGMLKGTFNNKLSDSHPTQFSDKERIQLIGILREMSNDIDKVTGIDFNDALKTIVK